MYVCLNDVWNKFETISILNLNGNKTRVIGKLFFNIRIEIQIITESLLL